MSGICDTCHREPCHMRFDGCKTCDVYEGGETRWERLFGTPERAARTLRSFCEDCSCGDCATCGVPGWADYSHDYDAILEWLGGDAE